MLVRGCGAGASSCRVLVFCLVGLLRPSLGPALDPSQSVRHYQLTVWTTAAGLPNNFVQSLIQTSDGYLWLGTLEGLVRFDGHQWAVFDTRNTPELKHNSVVSLCEDRHGVLWIGTSGGGVARYYRGRFLPALTTANGLPNGYVREIYEDPTGDIWITAHDGGLVRYRDGKLTVFTVADGLPSNSLRTVRMDRAGRLWIGTNQSGLVIREGSRWKRLGVREGLPCGRIRVLYEDPRGRMWVGTRGCGLLLWTGDGFQRYTVEDGLPSNLVRSVLEDRDGNLWVATETGGVARLREGRWERLGVHEGLPHHFVRSLWEDSEGNLWLGTRGGLVRLRNRPIRSFTTAEGLTSDNVRVVFADGRDRVWIGTGTGLNYLVPPGQITKFPLSPRWSEDAVRALAQTEDGTLWVGTENSLYQVDTQAPRVLRRFGVLEGLPAAEIWALTAARDGGLWIGTRRGLARWRGGSLKRVSLAPGLDAAPINALLESHDGALWIGTTQGLWRWWRGSLRHWVGGEELGHEFVNCLAPARDSGVWVGTRGGLTWIRDGRGHTFRRRRGLPSDNVLGVVEQDGKWLWLTSPRGVYRLSRQELVEFAEGRVSELHPVVFSTLDGMRSSECNGGAQPTLWLARDGTLWIPTVHGVAVLDTKNPPDAGAPPRLMLEGASVGPLEIAAHEDTFELRSGADRVELRYTAISLGAPERIRFRYRLEGFDEQWVEAGQRRVASYTNLPPGSYRFRVQAYASDGRWPSQETAATLLVRPRFHQTVAFYLLCGTGGLGLALLAHRLRVRALRRRFHLVLSERMRIAREIHDTLMQGVAGVSLLLEAAAQKILTAPEQARAEVDRALAKLDRVLREARHCILELRSPHPQRELASLVEELVAQIREGRPMQLELTVEGEEQPIAVPVREQLVWILREALSNAVRHSGATRCSVRLKFEGDGIELRVADNGRGFDPCSLDGHHFGIVGMRERAEEIGGVFELASALGAGTRVTVRAPRKGP